MIRDLREGAPVQAPHADVCIIGAGAAGIVLAVELLKHGKSVLLLEGGGREVVPALQEPYQSEITGLQHTGVHSGRFRAMGGTTTRWHGQILELDELDFTAREWIEGSGWPIEKSALAPYYARARKLEGLSSATALDEDVWRQTGQQAPDFESFESVLSRWCPEPCLSRVHADTLENHPGLTVWLHANAVGADWDGCHFRSICCKTVTGVRARFTADQFVFCLGGIESSRFFLQPEAAAGPWNRSGLLGRHFQDHIICCAADVEVTNPQALHAAFDNVFSRGLKYQPNLHLRPEIQQQAQTLNVAASISFLSDLNDALGQLKRAAFRMLHGQWRENSWNDLVHAMRYSPLLARQVLRYYRHQRAYNAPTALIRLIVYCEQEPGSKSNITLSDTRDSLGMLRTRLDWQISDRELFSIKTLVEHAARDLAPIGRVIPTPSLMHLDPAFKEQCGDGYHHMGGMRMSGSASDGIVDGNLRLHGMSNGFVCSSAVFPCSGYSNPTHTILALAIRLADHLAEAG